MYSDNEVYKELRNSGFSDEEMLEMYQKESNKTGQNFKLLKALYEKIGNSYVFSKLKSITVSKFPVNPSKIDLVSFEKRYLLDNILYHEWI